MAAMPPLLLPALALTVLLLAAAGDPEQRLADERALVSARLRATENAASDSAQRVSELALRRQQAEQRLSERAAALAPLLPLAERLALFPAETLLAVPAPPEQTVRGLAVLHGLMRTVERQAAELRAELAQVQAAQRELDQALTTLRKDQAAQALEAAQLDRQLEVARSERVRADDAAADSARRAAAEAARAESVRGALDTMAAAKARAEAQIRQDAERAQRQRRDAALALARQREAQLAAPAGPGMRPGGAAVLPVAGPVVRRWGDETEAGRAHGMAFRAPPKGRVIAPCAGRVAFAGPFRSYGVLVILDCGGGYHFVLAGLDRLDTEAGASVRPGEPVGVMPEWDPASTGPRPALYVELRHDGQPVDPAPFLRPHS